LRVKYTGLWRNERRRVGNLRSGEVAMRCVFPVTAAFLLLLACSVMFGQTDVQAAPAQAVGIDPVDLVNKIAEKYGAAKQYAFAGALEVTRKIAGDQPSDVLVKAKVKLAVAPGGKYRLEIEDGGKFPYSFISDGQKRWAYIPTLKKYTEGQAAAATSEDVGENFEDPRLYAEPEIIDRLSRLAIPAIARLAETTEKVYRNGAVLTVLSKKDDRDGQNLMYLTVEPASLTVGRMVWVKATPSKGEKVLVRSAINFESFRIDEPTADSEFTFIPPKNTKRTSTLAIPRERGSRLLSKR
jgi:outer membrane lipoprotein-sorting protein